MRLHRHISSSFLGRALLTPNIGGMVLRDGVLGAASKGSRMKYHGTAPACSIAPYKVTRLFCPQCQDLIIAATHSQHVSRNEIRHWWVCETCSHEFRTTVRWLPSLVENEPVGDEAELLPSPREPLPAWNI